MNKDLTLEAVLDFEANTDLAAVVTMKGSVKLVMLTTPTFPSRYEVRFRKDGTRDLTSYNTDMLQDAVDLFNKHVARL